MARKTEAREARKPKVSARGSRAPKRTPEPRRKPQGRTAAKPVAKPTSKRAPKPRAVVRRAAPPVSSAAEDALAIEAHNRRYYDAFQTLSIDEIAKLWWHDDAASCIHPGWDARHGWSGVREAYEEIISNTRSIRFALGDVRVRAVGQIGYVTCVENLVSEEGDSGDFLGAVLATNVFERRGGEWRLIHHHASPFSSDDAELPEGPLH